MHIVFYSDDIGLRSGGPSGYIANLKLGLELIKSSDILVLTPKIPRIVRYLISRFPIAKSRRSIKEKVSAFFLNSALARLDWERVDSVICHTCADVLFIDNFLLKIERRNQVKILQMSHSPILPSMESGMDDLGRLQGNGESINFLKGQELASFRVSDAFIVPSQHAMDSYYRDSSFFRYLRKDILICPTGSIGLEKVEKQEARNRLKIDVPYIISFVGRHCYTKGYDRLIEIARKILAQRNDVVFLVAGRESNLIKPLNHPRWVELGWVDPSLILSASDVFISPNRDSYFDLVLLECMSLGCYIIASAVGGNLDLAKNNPGMTLYSSIETCVDSINSFLDLPLEERRRTSEAGIALFNELYSVRPFAYRYQHMLDSLKSTLS